MEPSKTANDAEADIAAKLAREWRQAPPLARPAALGAFVINMMCLFGGAGLGIAPIVGGISQPYVWILAAQIASVWIGVAMVWLVPHRYSLFHGWRSQLGRGGGIEAALGDRRIQLWGLWFPSMFALPLYYQYVSLVRWTSLLVPASGAGVLLLVAAVVPDHEMHTRRCSRFVRVLAVIACLGYGYAAAFGLNCVLDRSEGAVYRTVVSEKLAKGKGGPYLRIKPWGPESRSRKVAVPWRVFRSVPPSGDSVCVALKNGALGGAWFTVQSCSWNGGRISLGPAGSL